METHAARVKNSSILKAVYLYSILFFALMLFTLFLFQQTGKAPFQITRDGFSHFSTLKYIGEYIRTSAKSFSENGACINFYDFRIGLGDDIFVKLWVGLLNPVVFIPAAFFSPVHIEGLYWVISVIHMYLAGIAFIFFCLYHKRDCFASACGAVTYVFSGFAAYYFLRQYFFITSMILLPVMLLATDKIVNDKKPYLFIFFVTISIVINFYFTFVITIMALLYGLARFLEIYPQERTRLFFPVFLKGVGSYMLGILLSSPFLMPVAYKFLESGRRNSEMIYSDGLFLYSADKIISGFAHLFTPGGKFGEAFIGDASAIGEASMFPLCLFALACIFKKKRMPHKWLKVFLLLSICGLISPLVGYLFNVGAYVTDRWMFILSFTFSYILVSQFSRLSAWDKKDEKFCITAMLVYELFLVSAHILGGAKFNVATFFSIVVMLFSILLMSGMKNRTSLFSRKAALMAIIVLSAAANIYFLYIPRYSNFLKTFGPQGQTYNTIMKSPARLLDQMYVPDSTNFFRSDNDVVLGSAFASQLFFKQNGVSGYTSLINRLFASSQIELENIGLSQPWSFRGFNERAIQETLASVKYYAVNDKRKLAVPFGFEKTNSEIINENTYSIFKNKYFLPIGYTYEKYITRNIYQNFSALEKQETLLQSVVLEKTIGVDFRQEENLKFTNIKLPSRIVETDGVKWDGSTLKVEKKGAMTKIYFDSVHNAETYIHITGLDIEHTKHPLLALYVPVVYRDTRNALFLVPNYYSGYTGRKNYLVKLCSGTENSNEPCSIIWREPGTFKLDDIQVYAQPMDNYPAQINKLREDVLENIYVGNDRVSGTISLQKNKILCLSIPYSKGWHAKVDGKKAELLKANSLFMALPLEAGDHKIELEYHVPGLRLGLCFFILGVLILLGMMFYDKTKGKPHREEKMPAFN
ncbi:MAG: YfhO family protein [bacterium]|nr:YfhO family protein [bacterium]